MSKAIKEKTFDKHTQITDMLRRLRSDAGLQQGDIARILGVKDSTYSAYETGRIIPSAEKLYTLAKYYGINVEFLLSKFGNGEDVNGCAIVSSADRAEHDAGEESVATVEELLYYYRNLSAPKKKMVFELTKAMYMDRT
ncbi:helix-turn-helix domain-containing protein [Butyrivibrio sp. YAB3001]|uniref:helix-turn-helix domain-containing protein n=1 Tax=Butyrivibrio sp. YAB3001 TaxID=1520812 RepID=UPI001588095B|nr:helix-turn-helix transcriptional regulator [Butyrivibrio sp. YAB3001]